MYILSAYCLIGLVLLVVKSPVNRQINKDVKEFEVSCYSQLLATGKEIPHFKIKLYHFILFILLLFFYPFILYDNFFRKKAVPEEDDELVAYPFPPAVDTSMLTKKISVTEAETTHMVTIENRQVPFGYNNAQWQRFLSMMQEGDELWEFSSGDKSWEDLAGSEGLALVRNGKIIYDVLTCMN